MYSLELLNYLLLTYVMITLINTVISWLLWKSSGSDYYKMLVKFWIITFFYFILRAFFLSPSPIIAALLFSITFLVNWNISMLLARLLGLHFQKKLFITLIVSGIVLAIFFYLIDANPLWIMLPVTTGVSFPLIQTSINAIIKKWKSISLIMKGFTITLLLYGLHSFDYAFLFMNEEMQVPGFTLAMAFLLALTLFCPAAILEIIAADKEQLEITLKDKARLTQTAKLAALGEMAGGIAHEINNPLQILHGLSSMITKEVNKENINRSYILTRTAKIDETTARIAKIVTGLIAFSVNGSNKPFMIERLNNIVEGTLDLCRESIEREGIKLQVEIADPDIEIFCRKIEIQQALLNLINNSKMAIKGLQDKWVKIIAAKEADQVVVTVIDSGTGIPEQVAEKMFQPFYTTRDVGLGTGLGLSISKGIIKAHKGTLYYELKNGHTSFSFTLPV